jgi:hypothetical protein
VIFWWVEVGILVLGGAARKKRESNEIQVMLATR